MYQHMLPEVRKVAVIGAGPGGLAAARALKEEGDFETITVFERTKHVGGTWNYSRKVDTDIKVPSLNALEIEPPYKQKPFISPIYTDLHVNLPKTIMSFRDYPFSDDLPLFPRHNDVLKYLEDFAEHFNLLDMIQFERVVERIEPLEEHGWRVTTSCGKKKIGAPHKQQDEDAETTLEGKQDIRTEEYDAVIVATGHYQVPYIPDIPGLREFTKKHRVLHTCAYRSAKTFFTKGERVVVVGSGSSAADVVRESKHYGCDVYHSIRSETGFSKAGTEGVQIYPEIEKIRSPNTVVFEDGQKVENVDVIVFGTGYLYSFPFLDPSMDVIQDGQKARHLRSKMFYRPRPTLAFLGLPIRIVPFPLMQAQSILLARLYSQRVPYIGEIGKKNLAPDAPDDNKRSTMVFNADFEFTYVDHLNKWANMTPRGKCPATEPLPDWWKEQRKNSLALRKTYLGY
ncbi:hypothetical protein BCR43DRAFT_484553 [Syncephalastrum racemosum]|uniref:Uncharacterized protein n=1 Tax=Syncephalastrum racemosum TaxID=13706 RepID=A0A1X2HKX4_SYNRA|nr:hypothetical protein BCR43DRAFT_484553 [Syncephalastrum racemosum]